MAQDTAQATTKLRGLTAAFDNRIKSYAPFWPSLSMTVQSSGADERYAILGAVPTPREWLGERDFKELAATDWTLTNKTWEESVKIKEEAIQDDRLGMYVPVLEELGKRFAAHPDSLLLTLINNAESGTCFDGQFFFDTDHSWGDSGTQDNDLTDTAVDSAAVTVAECKSLFNTARQALLGFKDDAGELLNGPIYTGMSDLTLLVPPALEQNMTEALTAVLGTQGGTNIVIDKPNIVVSPSLTSSVKFDLYKTDQPLKPYIMQQRRPLRRAMEGAGKTTIEFKDVKFMADARYVAGYGAWWTGVRMTITTA